MSTVIPIESPDELPTGSKIILYGAGGFCQNVLKRLAADRPDIQVPLLSDSFKRGSAFGIELVPPEDLNKLPKSAYDLILVTAGEVSRSAIVEHLKKLEIRVIWTASDRLQSSLFYQNALDSNYQFNSINIELTGNCNMACRFCGFRNRKTDHMDFTLPLCQ